MTRSREAGPEHGRIVLGRIAGPFGVEGWVRIDSFTDPPEQLLEFPHWRAGDGRELRAVEGRRHGRGLIARLDGIDDRDAALALARGRPELWLERQELPPLGPDEYYRGDLIGLDVVNLQGERLGRLDHFLDLPANPVMVVIGERERWLPVGKGQLLRVDLARRRVVVDWDAEF